MIQRKTLKTEWIITSDAFNNLLAWLDDGENSEGERYLEIRRRLVNYFDRKGCLNSDDLADETLNRVARRLEEEGKIEMETPAKFCYVTAKFVFLESLRNKEKQSVPFDEVVENKLVSTAVNEIDLKELRLKCLDNCAKNLDIENREIIFRYYHGEKRTKIDNRRNLAAKYNLSVNALSIRACRIREKLQNCMEKCTQK